MPGCPNFGWATKIEVHNLSRPSRSDNFRRKTRVLRFRPYPEEAATGRCNKNGGASRHRWRLWMLLVALGLVLATMRQLGQPKTAQRLGQIFGAAEVVTQQQENQVVLGGVDAVEPPGVVVEKALAGEDASVALADVQDNTYFRSSETEAWFGLFERLQRTDAQKLGEATLGELTYTQLLNQPQVYRGKVVTIRGTLRREEVEHPAENSLGIEAYHRLMIQPRGGGHWPFVVYCLELPDNFPRGDNLQAPIAVTGYFFKNWSYAWKDGLGIAPVVLARSVDWQPKPASPARRTLASEGLTTALVAAGVFALLAVYLVFRKTRRPSHVSPASGSITFPKASSAETIHERLQQLADSETPE